MTTRAFLIIALLASLALALESNGRYRCRRTRTGFRNFQNIKNIETHPRSAFCDKMEIIVFLKDGIQYCLDPEVKKVQELITHLQTKETAWHLQTSISRLTEQMDPPQ